MAYVSNGALRDTPVGPAFGTDVERENALGSAQRFLSLFRRSWAPLCPDLLHEVEMGLARRD